MGVALNDEKDKPKWKWTTSGKFTVKSLYSHIDNSVSSICGNLIFLLKIATKDNMVKRKCVGSTVCRLCSEEETIHHLFFECVAV